MLDFFRPGDVYDASKVHEDIKYSAEDDKAIDEWIADHVEYVFFYGYSAGCSKGVNLKGQRGIPWVCVLLRS